LSQKKVVLFAIRTTLGTAKQGQPFTVLFLQPIEIPFFSLCVSNSFYASVGAKTPPGEKRSKSKGERLMPQKNKEI